MSRWMTPCLIVFIVAYGGFKGVDISKAFACGVGKGLKVIYSILPPLLLMTAAIQMVEASGAVDWLVTAIEPLARLCGLPADCLPLALIRPFSSAGALGVGINIMERLGVDSYPSRAAAVMLGSSESSLYTIGLYSARTGVKNSGRVLLAAFIGDLTAFMASAFFVRLLG